MNLSDYANHDALGLAALISQGEVTSVELVNAAADAIKAVNGKINAVIGTVEVGSRGTKVASEVLFSGVPFLLKDLGHGYAGVPSNMGSRLGQGFAVKSDSTLAQRFKASGLVAIGRSNTPEFGLSGATEPILHGPTRNPWDLRLTPGGSSGGAAAAVASGIVPIAHGSDAGGSIRIPAAWCGLVGLKPSRGLVPKGPDASDATLWLSVHFVLSRSVRDSAAMLDVLCGPAAGDYIAVEPPQTSFLSATEQEPRRLRIALSEALLGGPPTDPACVAATNAAARLCVELGHVVEPATPPIEAIETHSIGYDLFLSRVVSLVTGLEAATGRRRGPETLEAMSLAALAAAEDMTLDKLFSRLKAMERITLALDRFMTDYDLLLMPAVTSLPYEIGFADPERHLPTGTAYWQEEMPAYTTSPLFNIAGHPAISLPLYWHEEKIPLGAQFSAKKNGDALLFSLAAQLERAAPWSHRRPPVHVAGE